MKKYLLAMTAMVIVASTVPCAFAQKKGRVITLNEVTIVGRVQRPVAAVDVARIRPKITLSAVRRSFLDRIEHASHKDPF